MFGGYFLSHRWLSLEHLGKMYRFNSIKRWVRISLKCTIIGSVLKNMSLHNQLYCVLRIMKRNFVSFQCNEKRQLHFGLFLCHNGFCVKQSKGLRLLAFLFAVISLLFKEKHSHLQKYFDDAIETGLD